MGVGVGVGSGYFSYAIHNVHKRQGLIHCSMAARQLYPPLLTLTTLRD